MSIERIALAALTGLIAWVAMTVQAMTIDVAVIKTLSETQVSDKDFREFKIETKTRLESHQRWLNTLSDRVKENTKDK